MRSPFFRVDRSARTDSIMTDSQSNKSFVSIAVAKTKSAKAVNEDSCMAYLGGNISLIALADGLGSSTDSHIASALAIETIQAKAADLDRMSGHCGADIASQVWQDVAHALTGHFVKNRSRYSDLSSP